MANDDTTTSSSTTCNRIIHGDCLEVLPTLPGGCADFILTDPPYLAKYRSRDGRRIAGDDNDRWLRPAFAEMFRVLARDSFAVSFYGWPRADAFMAAFRGAGFRVVGHLVFPKRYASATRYVQYRHECAYLLAKGSPRVPALTIADVIDWRYTGNRLHPTQKPLAALLPLVDSFSRPGGLLVDPFAGSGSSLVAAHTLGRRFLGIELDAAYHRLASERLRCAGAAA